MDEHCSANLRKNAAGEVYEIVTKDQARQTYIDETIAAFNYKGQNVDHVQRAKIVANVDMNIDMMEVECVPDANVELASTVRKWPIELHRNHVSQRAEWRRYIPRPTDFERSVARSETAYNVE